MAMLTVSCSTAAAMLADASPWACEFSAISRALRLTPAVISLMRADAAWISPKLARRRATSSLYARRVWPISSWERTAIDSVKSSALAVRVMARCISRSGLAIERPSRNPITPMISTPATAADTVIARVREKTASADAVSLLTFAVVRRTSSSRALATAWCNGAMSLWIIIMAISLLFAASSFMPFTRVMNEPKRSLSSWSAAFSSSELVRSV